MTEKGKKTIPSKKKEFSKVEYQDHPEQLDDDYYFDSLHQRIVDYLTSGKVHSTLVGIVINLDGDKGKKDVIEATTFADYFVNFLKKVNN